MDSERRLSALKVQVKNPNRVNVYLDGAYSFGLSRAVAARLSVGQTLSDEKIAALKKQDAEEVVHLKALRYLGNRPHSEAEIRKKLGVKGYDEMVVQRTMERLTEEGYLGDSQFARIWVDNRSTFRPRSRRLLTFELRQRGVAEEIINDALQETADEPHLAIEAARRYVRRLAGLDRNKFREKLTAYLGRRGFSYDVAAPVVRKVWEELQSQHLIIQKPGEEEK